MYYVAAFLFLILLIIRLVQIQILERKGFAMIADIQYKYEVKLPPERGKILDRNFTTLAINIPTVSVIANPNRIKNRQLVAQKLSPLLGKSANYFSRKLNTKADFVYLSRHEPKTVGDKIEKLDMDGVYCRIEMFRRYPKGRVASQLLGFTNIDGDGLSGVELSCESFLRGKPGKAILQRTGTSKLFRSAEYPVIPEQDGYDVMLTLDYIYQSIAEKELQRTVQESNADSGTVVIMDPTTGEILAIASAPDFNPNQPGKFQPSSWRLRPITDQFEPGSTFKIVLFSAVLNEGLKNPEDLVFCENGKYSLMGETIHDTSPHGWLTMGDVLVKSSNIGMAKTALEVDNGLLYRYARDFGFGAQTGIELKGEIGGVLKSTIDWSGYTPVAMAIGHEVAVTALQACNMFSTVANGGILMQPYIVKSIQDVESGKVVQRGRQKMIRRVIKQSTADIVKDYMQEVVERGTAKRAHIDNLEICGKTGTARMVKPGQRGYRPNEHIASFGGFFPKQNPKVSIFVMIENPKGRYHGGEVAAPCFRRITEQIIAINGKEFYDRGNEIVTEDSVSISRFTVPQFVGVKKKNAQKMASFSRVDVETVGHGDIIVSQEPRSGQLRQDGEKIVLETNDNKPYLDNMLVPDVTGLPLRNALNVLASRGIFVRVVGSGKVVKQQPLAGHKMGENEQVLLHCESSIDLRKLLVL